MKIRGCKYAYSKITIFWQTIVPGNTPNELITTNNSSNVLIDVELRPRKKKPVTTGTQKTRASSLKRGGGAGIGTSQRPTTHAELLHLVDSLVQKKLDLKTV